MTRKQIAKKILKIRDGFELTHSDVTLKVEHVTKLLEEIAEMVSPRVEQS